MIPYSPIRTKIILGWGGGGLTLTAGTQKFCEHGMGLQLQVETRYVCGTRLSPGLLWISRALSHSTFTLRKSGLLSGYMVFQGAANLASSPNGQVISGRGLEFHCGIKPDYFSMDAGQRLLLLMSALIDHKDHSLPGLGLGGCQARLMALGYKGV